jgi:pyrimidine operon attenuation protein/uracil phosphoribosyltransferase
MEPECVAFILQIAMQNMRKMENRLMKHVNDISDQLDNKLDSKVYGVGYEMRTEMAILQERLQEKVQENNDLKERLGSLEYTVYKNAIAVEENLKKKDNEITQLKDELEKLKDKK